MKALLIGILLLTANLCFAGPVEGGSKELRAMVAKTLKTRSDTDFKKSVARLKTEAELADLRIQITLNNLKKNSYTITDVADFINRSREKAAILKGVNDHTDALVKLGESFISPTNEGSLSEVLTMQQHDLYDDEEVRLPEYRNPAFNKELARTANIRAHLFFYF
jgi:hypothetical protein